VLVESPWIALVEGRLFLGFLFIFLEKVGDRFFDQLGKGYFCVYAEVLQRLEELVINSRRE
jgi:hypothetical protein